MYFTYKSNHATIGNGNLIGEVLVNSSRISGDIPRRYNRHSISMVS